MLAGLLLPTALIVNMTSWPHATVGGLDICYQVWMWYDGVNTDRIIYLLSLGGDCRRAGNYYFCDKCLQMVQCGVQCITTDRFTISKVPTFGVWVCVGVPLFIHTCKLIYLYLNICVHMYLYKSSWGCEQLSPFVFSLTKCSCLRRG